MKKGSIMIILQALIICLSANGQQVANTIDNINLSQSGLAAKQEPGNKNTVSDDASVQLTAFSAQSTGKAIVLNWSTISEQNNVGFELERMEEGENQFRTIDFVEGNETNVGSVSYEYIDAFAGNAYYRLKQINLSGTYEYSKAIYVEASHIEKVLSPLSVSTVLVYPYPASSYVNIEVKTDESTSFNVRVMDMMGKEFSCPVISKNNSGNKLTLGMDGLSNGMYMLVIQSGTTSVSKKIFLETN
ncbi:MAG: T9SS type A sorting domain-containing protein [Bacteroidia bacterium]|nr:T9SS type A sorting domain-containing protein [Bacteroidia bacterium]